MMVRFAVPALVLALALVAGARADEPQTLGSILGGGGGNKPIGIEAEKGIEWQQDNHLYIARGHVKATRGDVTVYADTLYAYYRPVTPAHPPAAGAAPAPAPAQSVPLKTGSESLLGGGSTEIYRLEADGNVHFATPTQSVYGGHAVYDVDRALLVVTGKGLRMVTPREEVTARDSLEWYDRQQLAVARGNAIGINEGKRIAGDVLTAEVEHKENQPARVSRVNAQGHVIVTSADQVARGDQGVYNLDNGIATLMGHVSLTRGGNELRGQYAVVDTNKNIGKLLSAPPSAKLTGGEPKRVEGLLVPRPKPGEATQ